MGDLLLEIAQLFQIEQNEKREWILINIYVSKIIVKILAQQHAVTELDFSFIQLFKGKEGEVKYNHLYFSECSYLNIWNDASFWCSKNKRFSVYN